jgi:hypothetical protein
VHHTVVMKTMIVGALMTFALATLATVGTAAAAKPCRRLCRDAIRSCVTDARSATSCTGLRGAEKRDCRRALASEVHACKGRDGFIYSACRERPTLTTCSPSGAFVD